MMRKHIFIAALILATGMSSFAQKKAGTIYSEHEAIQKTQQFWQALAKGDVDTYVSLLADSVWVSANGGDTEKVPAKELSGMVNWFANNFENLKVQDDKPAYPDALEYKEGGLWVQDWILLTGRHKESGINLDLSIHNLYRFDENGKIGVRHMYFNNDVFQNIRYSATTRENGKVYINHPYISVVRKVVNAFTDRDVDAYASYFADNAIFSDAWQEWGESMTLEETREQMKKNLSNKDMKFWVEEIGYPDCIYYEEGNQYVVYSWWKYTAVIDGKEDVTGVMMTHAFNKDGKIVRETVFQTSK